MQHVPRRSDPAARRRLREPLPDREAGRRDFTEEDEEIVELLAAQAAVAIENARLYESATRWSRQLESLNEVGDALVGEIELRPLLELVARRLRELLGARSCSIALPLGDGELGSRRPTAGTHAQLVGIDARRRALEERRRVSSASGASGSTRCSTIPRSTRQARAPASACPSGALRAAARPRPGDRRDRRPRQDRRATALHRRRRAPRRGVRRARGGRRRPLQRVERDALRRVVAAQELERRRLARELHDETGQALTSILLGLQAARGAPTDDERAARARDAARARRRDPPGRPPARGRAAADGARRFRPRAGARAARATVPERTARRSSSRRSVGERLPPEVETALYRIVQEALTNVVKHAGATAREHPASRREGSSVDGRDRGRRRRLRPRTQPRRTGSGSSACASGRAARRRARRRVERPARARRVVAEVPRPVIRVLIVDDHAVVRSGLRLLLDARTDIECVGEAGDAEEAVLRGPA